MDGAWVHGYIGQEKESERVRESTRTSPNGTELMETRLLELAECFCYFRRAPWSLRGATSRYPHDLWRANCATANNTWTTLQLYQNPKISFFSILQIEILFIFVSKKFQLFLSTFFLLTWLVIIEKHTSILFNFTNFCFLIKFTIDFIFQHNAFCNWKNTWFNFQQIMTFVIEKCYVHGNAFLQCQSLHTKISKVVLNDFSGNYLNTFGKNKLYKLKKCATYHSLKIPFSRL